MRIEGFVWLNDVEDKLAVKHQVSIQEVEEVFEDEPEFRFVEKGHRKGEDVYMALGRTEAGRYLAVLFILKTTNEALILTARDMADKERKYYGRK
ncbi:MAG: BrnT family toxin [Acidobacteriota bacterium]